MTSRQAIAWVRQHGVVLESARGRVPSFAAHVAGSPITGSWWGHPRSHEIFRLTRAVRASADILVCRLVAGKVTYVHRRLWPAIVRAAGRLPRARIAKVIERHTSSGRHETHTVPFPRWVPADVRRAAPAVDVDAALESLGLS